MFTDCKHQEGRGSSGSAGTWLGPAGEEQGQDGGLSLALSAVNCPEAQEEGSLWALHSQLTKPHSSQELGTAPDESLRQGSRIQELNPGISVRTLGVALECGGAHSAS